MSIAESWVANPIVPWLITILVLWIIFSTMVQARNWFRIRKLERHNKLLQEMLVEGVGNVARRITFIENRIPILKSNGIRPEEQPAAAIEETIEDWDEQPVSGCQSPTGTKSGSSQEDQSKLANTGS